MRVYLPVIVTTAALKVCAYDNPALDLPTGTLKTATFEDGEFTRFRKQVGATPTALSDAKSPVEARVVANAKESTVFVVSVNHLNRFLDYFKLEDRELLDMMQSSGDEQNW